MMGSKFADQYLQQEELEEQNHENRRTKFLPMLCSSTTSTKQVVIKLSHQQHRRNSSTSSTTSSTVSDEPSSPRVGCMGQVKRNNKVVGFPTSTFTNTTTTNSINITSAIKNDQIIGNTYTANGIVKYYKLKRFFSSKTLTGSPTTTIAAATAVTRKGTHKGKIKNNSVVPHSHKGAMAASTVRNYHNNHHRIKTRSKVDENHGGIVTASNDKTNENIKGCLVNLVELDPPLPVVKQLQGNNNGEGVSLWKRRSGGTPLKSLHVQTIPQNSNLVLQATTV